MNNNKKLLIQEKEHQIRLLERYNELDKDAIRRFEDVSKIHPNIEKLNQSIENREKSIEEIRLSIFNIDDFMEKNCASKPREVKKDVKRKKIEYVQHDNFREMYHTQRFFWKQYNSFMDTIPLYMVKMIETSSNNKAWIWKGIVLYGLRPAEDTIVDTLYEQINKVHHIYYVTPKVRDTYIIEKIKSGKGVKSREKFVSRKFRRNINGMNIDDSITV